MYERDNCPELSPMWQLVAHVQQELRTADRLVAFINAECRVMRKEDGVTLV